MRMPSDRTVAWVQLILHLAVLVLLALLLDGQAAIHAKVAPTDGWRGATTKRLEALEHRLEGIERTLAAPGGPTEGR